MVDRVDRYKGIAMGRGKEVIGQMIILWDKRGNPHYYIVWDIYSPYEIEWNCMKSEDKIPLNYLINEVWEDSIRYIGGEKL